MRLAASSALRSSVALLPLILVCRLFIHVECWLRHHNFVNK